MDSSSAATEVLANSLDRAGSMGEAQPAYKDALSGAVGSIILSELKRIPLKTHEETRSVEGSVGIIPPPAKRVIVESFFKGENRPPVKASDEIIVVEDKKKHVDNLTFHGLCELSPTNACSPQYAKKIIAIMKSFVELADAETLGKELGIGIGEINIILHIFKKGVLGNFSLESIRFKLEDIVQAIKEYKDAAISILSFDKGALNEESVGLVQFGQQLAEELAADNTGSKISVPFVIEKINSRGSDLIYRVSNLYDGARFINLTNRFPEVVHYDKSKSMLIKDGK